MNGWAQLGVILLIGVVLYSVVKRIVQTRTENQYMQWFGEGKFDRILASIDSWKGKWLFPLYNRDHLKLQVAQMTNDKEQIDALLDKMLAMKTTPEQRKEIVMRAFEYFIYEQDRRKAKPLYQEIKQHFDKKTAHRARLMYEVYITHKGDLVDELLELAKTIPDSEKGTCYLLLAQSYKNKHDDEKQREYEQLAKQYL